MRTSALFRLLLPLIAAISLTAAEPATTYAQPPTLLDFTVNNLGGSPVNLADYYGRPVLVVNVASKCGLTPQYTQLQALYDTYKTQGLAIVGFPCNDFGKQEPGSADEIQAFCQKNYGVTFDMMEKVSVAPGKRHPFYEKLIADAGGPDKIRWNFEKFLIGRDGKIAARFEPKTKPQAAAVVSAVEKALSAPEPEPLAYRSYMGRPVAQTMHWSGADWFTRREREKEEGTSKMLAALALKPGMIVADIGCGNGYHALPMAKSVAPNGKVIGSDIQPQVLELLKKRAADAKVANVETVTGSYTDPKLPENAIDLALIVDAYHEFSHPPQMLAAIRKSLKADGQLVLVEFRAEDRKVPIKPEHKMAKPQVIRELAANGFKLARSYDDLPWQHMLFFEKE